jgi:hypothetical protein
LVPAIERLGAVSCIQGVLASVSAVAIGQTEKVFIALISRGICGQVASSTQGDVSNASSIYAIARQALLILNAVITTLAILHIACIVRVAVKFLASAKRSIPGAIGMIRGLNADAISN